MAAQKYDIREAFRYTAATPDGDIEGEFKPGITGDLTDEQAAYLELIAVPAGLASVVGTEPHKLPAAPQEPAPAPSDKQEQAQ